MTFQPFLSSLQAPSPPRSFASTLPVHETGPVTSPWTPAPSAAPVEQPVIDVVAIRDAAIAEGLAEGRAQGLAETSALRTQLARLVSQMTAAANQASALASAHIAEAATTVIGAWLGETPAFAPIIAGWLATCTGPATVRVNPADVEAITAAIAEAPITVVEDPAIPPGDLQLRAPNHELNHAWSERIAELRTAIQAELTVAHEAASPDLPMEEG